MMQIINNYLKQVLAFCLLSFPICCLNGATYISPLDYGLKEARTGVERFWALYRVHLAAIETDAAVDYRGIGDIDIEIPKDAKSVPLTSKTYFRGVRLTVLNNSKSFFLFEMAQPETTIDMAPKNIDNASFHNYKPLRKGRSLLILEDENLWVKQRKGYNYGHTRRDILLVCEGRAQNAPISAYNNSETKAKVSFVRVNNKKKRIDGIKFYRNEKSTQKTYLLNLNNQYNVIVSDIEIHTPQSSMIGDQAIRIGNCCCISFQDIKIDGTYSAVDNYGYGISMNNVYDVRFKRLKSKSDWGIFGNNNVNNVTLANCDINRFDVHCYGKDIYMKKCVFRDLYNQFSSMKGEVVFDRCEFIDFTPFLYENSYNAYTRFNMVFIDCVVYASKKRNYLIDARSLNGGETDERTELRVQQYPNLIIKGLKVVLGEDMDLYYSYKLGRNMEGWEQESLPGEAAFRKLKIVSSDRK